MASEQLLADMKPDGTVQGDLSRWDALVAEVADNAAARTCVSDGKAPEHVVARIVADLGGSDVHVVAVAWNYETYLPSQ